MTRRRQRTANCAASREIRTLEDALALRHQARERLKHAATRMLHTARTREDAENIEALIETIAELDEMGTILQQFHPDRLEDR